MLILGLRFRCVTCKKGIYNKRRLEREDILSVLECFCVRSNFYKSFWTDQLTALKQALTDAHNLWRLCEAPRFG